MFTSLTRTYNTSFSIDLHPIHVNDSGIELAEEFQLTSPAQNFKSRAPETFHLQVMHRFRNLRTIKTYIFALIQPQFFVIRIPEKLQVFQDFVAASLSPRHENVTFLQYPERLWYSLDAGNGSPKTRLHKEQ